MKKMKFILFETVDDLKKKLEISENKFLSAESNQLILLNELQDTTIELMTVASSNGGSSSYLTVDCEKCSSLDLITAENKRLEEQLQELKVQYNHLHNHYNEIIQQSELWDTEKAKLKEYFSKMYEIISDCSQKLTNLEKDQRAVEHNFSVMDVVLKNAINGINFFRLQLEKERKQNSVTIQLNSELLAQIEYLEETNRSREDIINQLRAEIKDSREASIAPNSD